MFGKKIIYPIVSEGSDYFAYIGAVGTLVMAVLAWWTIRGSRKQLRYQTESTMHAKLSDAVATLESSLFPEQAGRILFMTTQGSVPATSLEESLRNLLDANYNRVQAILN